MTLPETLTYGTMIDIATKIQTPEEGANLVAALAERARKERPELTESEAVAMTRSNLGYLAGYCDVETQRRFERVFAAAHPVFGPVGGDAEPKTVAETIRMGIAAGRSPA